MTLKDLVLKPKYRSSRNDILQEFLVPCLKEASSYDRAVGFFSGKALQLALGGIVDFIKREDSKIRIITSPLMNERDVSDIQEGIKQAKNVIESRILDEVEALANSEDRALLASLGWLISRRKLEIRLGDVNIRNHHLFHDKLGIFKDHEGNRVAFFGSLNETYLGYRGHYDAIRVITSWSDPKEKMWEEENDFDLLWDDLDPMVKIYEVSEAIERGMIQYAPKRFEDVVELMTEYGPPIVTEREGKSSVFNPMGIKPWPPQKRAIQNVKEHDYSGILKMATGTGKTIVALLSMEQFFKDYGRYGKRVVVVVPSLLLGQQWKRFLHKNTGEDDLVFLQGARMGTVRKRDLARAWKNDWIDEEKRNIFLIINIQNLQNFKSFDRHVDLLIADEVHEYGTRKRMKKFWEKFGHLEHSIGLSATPERYYDYSGTRRVLDYFGQIIFSYGIKQAQNEEIRPGGVAVLSKYNYYPYVSYLEPKEERDVKNLSEEIARIVAMTHREEISEQTDIVPERAKKLMTQRALILKTSNAKEGLLERILTENRQKLDQCIVYCEDSTQLEAAIEVFERLDIRNYVQYHSLMRKRDEALDLFRGNPYKFVLSMHCLDQGVDIPDCHSLILLSSSGNPREYIQRRGRVLRNYEGKPMVNIYDTLVFPKETNEIYGGMITTRLLRAWEFLDCSQTPEEAAELDAIRQAYSIREQQLRTTIERWRGA